MGGRHDHEEEQFQALARAAREAMLIHDKGIVVEINDAFTRLLGWTRDEIVGKNGLEVIIDPASADEVRSSMQATGAAGTREVVVWTKDRRKLVVESASEPIHYQGRALRVVTMQDMTERKALEAQAHRTGTLLKGIVDATNQPIFVKDRQGGLLLVNRAWRELFDPGDHATTDVDAFSADVAASFREDEHRIEKSGEPSTFETDLQTAQGRRSLLVTKFPLKDTEGRTFAFGGIATDLTDRKLTSELFSTIARATLGATGQAYFEALARAMSEALRADYAFIGELNGRTVRTLSTVVDGQLSESLEYNLAQTPCEQVMDHAACVYRERVQQLFPRDEMLVELGVHAYCGVPITGIDGAPRGILVALFREPLDPRYNDEVIRVALELFAARAAAELDRMAAIHELELAKSELERRVEERTAELTAANKELEAFAYSVSHDLRAPVRHITGFAELLEMSAEGSLSDEARRHLSVIQSASKKMNDLIGDLLALSRNSRAPLEPRLVALEPLVRKIARDVEQTVDSDDDVEWELGELPCVHGDPSFLSLALTNLLENAVKYSRGSKPRRIEVRCETRPDEWEIFVRDNGVGFDMKHARQLFGVFNRLHGNEFDGTGVGLATVHRIVARHGGTVTAESAVGEGACFSFTLPRRAELD